MREDEGVWNNKACTGLGFSSVMQPENVSSRNISTFSFPTSFSEVWQKNFRFPFSLVKQSDQDMDRRVDRLPIFHLGSPRKMDPTKCQVSFQNLRKKLFFGELGGVHFIHFEGAKQSGKLPGDRLMGWQIGGKDR